MKLVVAIIVVSLSCTYGQRGKKEEKYTERYDAMNIDEMLANKRLISAYMRCIDWTGKCTAEGRYLKAHITDALQTGCKKCTESQHKNVRKVVKYIIEKEPMFWEKLVKMYDPKGEYSKKYAEELNSLKQGSLL